MRYLFPLLLGFCLMTAFLSIAKAQHPPEHQNLHDKFYSTWQMAVVRDALGRRTNSCCSNHDCYPTRFRNVAGVWFAFHRETQSWIPVPESRLEHNTPDPRESPDGHSHLCASALTNVYCAVLGGET